MKKLMLYLFVFNSFVLYSQETKIDLDKLNTKVLTLVNNYRASLQVKPLLEDSILKKAAENQSCFIAKEQSLTHDQPAQNKSNPKNRVYFYKGNDFILVGENILFTSIKDNIYTDADLDVLANKMFDLWKKSPNHLKIMTDSKFTYTALGFCLDWDNKRIYAAQVFGAK